jgi:hypothetical protein
MGEETEKNRQGFNYVTDPSSLTTQQLWREIAALKELVFIRLEGIEKAIKVAHDDLVRVPTDVMKQVGNLRDLHEEKFASVQKQFQERDERVKQNAQDTKVAVDAALQAAKELVALQNISLAQSSAKQEASFSKQIDAQGLLIQTTAKASDDKIDDLKDRMTRIEGRGEGLNKGWIVLLGAVSLIATIVGIVALFWRR